MAQPARVIAAATGCYSYHSGELAFFDDDGAPFSVSLNDQPAADHVPFTLPGSGGASFRTNARGPLMTGSARVTATAGVGGVLSLSAPGSGIAGVWSSPRMTRLIAPVRRNVITGVSTGLAITACDTGAALRLILRHENGEAVSGGDAIIELPANGHAFRFIEELFPGADTADFIGSLTVESHTGEIAATAIESGRNAEDFTSVPVAPLR